MKPIKSRIKQAVVISACVVIISCLTACSTSSTSVLPQGGPTMQSIYEQHQTGDNANLNNTVVVDRSHPDDDFMHADASGVNARFVRLPNPELVMYITPHLSDKGYPVPGYTTVFQMYDKTYYALPGETTTRIQQNNKRKTVVRPEPK